jgi:hypothetical protein
MDQDIDGAEFVAGLSDAASGLARNTNICLDNQASALKRFDRLTGRFCFGAESPTHDSYVCALLCQGNGGGCSNTFCAAGHQGN